MLSSTRTTVPLRSIIEEPVGRNYDTVIAMPADPRCDKTVIRVAVIFFDCEHEVPMRALFKHNIGLP